MEALFENINLALKDFAMQYQYKISMEQVHYKKLQNTILSRKKLIKSSIWNQLKENTINEKAKYLYIINKFENFHAFVQRKSQLNMHSFNIDCEALFNEYVFETYGEITYYDKQNPDIFRDNNLKRFSRDEQYEIQQNERLKSLIFFEDATETVKTEIKKEEINTPVEGVGGNKNASTIEVLSSDNLRTKPLVASNGRKGVFTPKESNNRKQKEKGNSSEQIVFDYLNRMNLEVYWASRDNEGLHYDLRYLNENGILKYVDAKTFDNGSFHLSKEEYDFGVEKKEDYEIWLVQDQKIIIPIKDFFTNEKYEKIVKEYLVHLDIIEN